jgi:hypothetical protein
MKYELTTLADITETKAKFDKNDPAWHQQQNFLTVLQTIGLRVNITYTTTTTIQQQTAKSAGFGTVYKGKNNVWKFVFETDFDDATNIETMTNDFNMVPIITNLDETAEFKNNMFESKNTQRMNILIKQLD